MGWVEVGSTSVPELALKDRAIDVVRLLFALPGPIASTFYLNNRSAEVVDWPHCLSRCARLVDPGLTRR